MKSKMQSCSYSDKIRIYDFFLNLFNHENNRIEFVQETTKVITVGSKKVKVSLEERFANYADDNLAKDFLWNSDKGKEIC